MSNRPVRCRTSAHPGAFTLQSFWTIARVQRGFKNALGVQIEGDGVGSPGQWRPYHSSYLVMWTCRLRGLTVTCAQGDIEVSLAVHLANPGLIFGGEGISAQTVCSFLNC